MFYRRKIILALLELFNGELDKISLQKLLFLVTKAQAKPEYHFVPFRYGCFSFSADADLKTMVTKGFLENINSKFQKKEPISYLPLVKEADRKILMYIKSLYGNMDADALMKHTYINHPYYAINSLRAAGILNAEEQQKVKLCKPQSNETILFTIGYEGVSLEEYLNKLIQNDVKVLVDVRNNPLSMKYGFSKSQLRGFCENLGIKYLHVPEFGIRSEQRQELNTQADYDKLFATYRKDNLSNTKEAQLQLLDLLKEHERIALTCFEADICQCHRKHLAESIASLQGFTYKLKHI